MLKADWESNGSPISKEDGYASRRRSRTSQCRDHKRTRSSPFRPRRQCRSSKFGIEGQDLHA
jgi:hypothetical protein